MNSLGINLVDIGIVLVLLYFIRDGYRKGMFSLSLEMFGFLLGVFLALIFYSPVGAWLSGVLGMSRFFAKVVSFIVIWLGVEAIVTPLTAHLYMRVPVAWLKKKWNNWLGTIPGLLEAVLLCTFLLSLAVSFPFPSALKQRIFASHMGAPMVRAAQEVEFTTAGVMSESGRETMSFMTVGRQERESVNLGFSTEEFFPDPEAEKAMFDLINEERSEIGANLLVLDQSLVEIARRHAGDMFQRGYFAHVSPGGKDVSDRAMEVNIIFERIAENLAHAPEVSMAHAGLMNSIRHRRNIRSSQFSRVGVGVQNAGANGMMFVQVFAD